MDIVFKCPNCRQELEVEASASGHTIACPSCDNSITIPAPDATNIKVGIAAHTSAAAKEEKHFSVPVSEKPVEMLIKKALPTLDAAAKDGSKKLRIKTIRHSDCKEVGHDNFDTIVTQVLNQIGDDNIVSINSINYSYIELGSQKILADFGVMIVYRG
jgi:DNA-directed RNA polymerase subunit RPC12/RpoP